METSNLTILQDQMPQQTQQRKTPCKSSTASSPLPSSQKTTPNVLSESKKQNAMVSPVLFKLHKLSKSPSSFQKGAGVVNSCSEAAFSASEKQKKSFSSGRYNSPTDSLISPISKGLLIRSRRATRVSYTLVPPKALDKTYGPTAC